MAMAFDEDEPDLGAAPGLMRAMRNETLISVTSEGGSALAEEAMRRAAPSLAAGVRRGVPFLGRRRATATAGEPSTVRGSEFGRELEEPSYICPLAVEPGGSRAMLALDANAIAFMLEGMLGGDGTDTPKLPKKGLSAPQRAFIDRILGSIVLGLSGALAKSIGLSLTKLPQLVNERSADGVLVQLPIDFRDVAPKTETKKEFTLDDFDAPSLRGGANSTPGESPAGSFGTILLAVSKSALNAARAATQSKKIERVDWRIAATMREVRVNVVAELGRLKLKLGDLAKLRVGDTLRLDVQVNGEIDVRVENQALFKGRPTTLGSQLAIEIIECRQPEVRHEPDPPPKLASEPPGPRGAASPLRR